MSGLHRLIRVCDEINERIGRLLAWFTLGMVAVTFAVVVMRYGFSFGRIWIQEIAMYLHAAVFMLGAGYTLLRDGHVRVDVFYSEMRATAKAWVDFAGTLLLLIPSCVVLLVYTWDFVVKSWAILEGPMSIGGIPAVYLLKTLIPLFAALLLLQGVSLAIRSLAAALRSDGQGA